MTMQAVREIDGTVTEEGRYGREVSLRHFDNRTSAWKREY